MYITLCLHIKPSSLGIGSPVVGINMYPYPLPIIIHCYSNQESHMIYCTQGIAEQVVGTHCWLDNFNIAHIVVTICLARTNQILKELNGGYKSIYVVV